MLFESETITAAAGNVYQFVAFAPDGRDIAPIAIRRFNVTANTTALVPDANFSATYRFFHASAGADPIDVYFDDPLTVPAVSGLPFKGISVEDIARSAG